MISLTFSCFDISEDKEEEDLLYTDAYEGMKLRSKSRHGSVEENGRIAHKKTMSDTSVFFTRTMKTFGAQFHSFVGICV